MKPDDQLKHAMENAEALRLVSEKYREGFECDIIALADEVIRLQNENAATCVTASSTLNSNEGDEKTLAAGEDTTPPDSPQIEFCGCLMPFGSGYCRHCGKPKRKI